MRLCKYQFEKKNYKYVRNVLPFRKLVKYSDLEK